MKEMMGDVWVGSGVTHPEERGFVDEEVSALLEELFHDTFGQHTASTGTHVRKGGR